MSKVTYNADQVQSVFDANPSEDSIIVTSCGNVFHTRHELFAKNHCREAKSEYEILTREQFNSAKKGGKSKTNETPDLISTDWKELKFKEIVEFAKSQGFEPTTTTNKGKPALIEEVEAFIATMEPNAPVADETTEDEEDYSPVGLEDLDSKTAAN